MTCKKRRFLPYKTFWNRQDGAVAVEFAFVAIPFLAILLGILELGFIFLSQSSLDNALEVAMRSVRTGALTSAQGSTAFKTRVCSQLSWISPTCSSDLLVDVRSFPDLTSVNLSSPVSGGTIDASKLKFDTGGPRDIILARVFYRWKLIAPLLQPGMANLSKGEHLLSSSAVFRNESYIAP